MKRSKILEVIHSETPDEPFESEFTIGEIIPGLEAVTSYPKMPVQILDPKEMAGQHWSLEVDAIIGPDGQRIKFSSGVPNAKKPIAILDTGFSLPPVPRVVSDAFYGRVRNAQFSEDSGLWFVPCDQELIVGFVIGGITYYIHPLDTVLVAGTYDDGSPLCVGAFQPNPLSFGSEIFDMVLGDAFLRNVYTYINFGDWEDVTARTTRLPYIQLLNTTNPSRAHQEFVKARMNGVDRTKDSRYALLPSGKGQDSKGDKQNNLASYTYVHSSHPVHHVLLSSTTRIIIISVVAAVLLILGLMFFFVCRCYTNRRNRNRLQRFGLKGVETKQAYRPLEVPAPQAHPVASDPKSYGYYGSGFA